MSDRDGKNNKDASIDYVEDPWRLLECLNKIAVYWRQESNFFGSLENSKTCRFQDSSSAIPLCTMSYCFVIFEAMTSEKPSVR